MYAQELQELSENDTELTRLRRYSSTIIFR